MREYLDSVAGWLGGPEAMTAGHGELEERLQVHAREQYRRWTTPGAEAVLRLCAVIANGDFDEYWQWHQQQELRRNHLDHYQELDLAA